MSNNTIYVRSGTLVAYKDLGVYVNADFNEDDGGRPYVSIDTSDMTAEWRYDEKTGLRASGCAYSLELTAEQPLAEWTITGPHGVAAVVRQQDDEMDHLRAQTSRDDHGAAQR
jgi:hypothetical protein